MLYSLTFADPSYSAWYQVPKPGPGPYPSPSAYERPPPSFERGYHGYGVPRHGGYNPEGSMMPQMPRKTPVSGYYLHHQQSMVPSAPDVSQLDQLEKFWSEIKFILKVQS